MDKSSVTRPSPLSTKVLVADEGFCKQVAALLLCKVEPIRNAFIGEPVEDVLAMVRWSLSHEDDEGFDPAKVLTNWAKKRNRGVWGEKPGRAARVVWGEQEPEDVDLGEGEVSGNGHDGDGDAGNGDGVPETAEREIALHIAEYWKANPERLVEALRWSDTNGYA